MMLLLLLTDGDDIIMHKKCSFEASDVMITNTSCYFSSFVCVFFGSRHETFLMLTFLSLSLYMFNFLISLIDGFLFFLLRSER